MNLNDVLRFIPEQPYFVDRTMINNYFDSDMSEELSKLIRLRLIGKLGIENLYYRTELGSSLVDRPYALLKHQWNVSNMVLTQAEKDQEDVIASLNLREGEEAILSCDKETGFEMFVRVLNHDFTIEDYLELREVE